MTTEPYYINAYKDEDGEIWQGGAVYSRRISEEMARHQPRTLQCVYRIVVRPKVFN